MAIKNNFIKRLIPLSFITARINHSPKPKGTSNQRNGRTVGPYGLNNERQSDERIAGPASAPNEVGVRLAMCGAKC